MAETLNITFQTCSKKYFQNEHSAKTPSQSPVEVLLGEAALLEVDESHREQVVVGDAETRILDKKVTPI